MCTPYSRLCIGLTAAVMLSVFSPAIAEGNSGTLVKKQALGGGVQVVPPSGSSAFCAGTFEIDTVANTCQYKIVLSDLASGEMGASIRGAADPGAIGAVLHTLPLGKVKSGTWNYPEADEADLLGGRMYVSVASTAFPSGEVRGQISDFVCVIDARQLGPTSSSPTSGFGAFQIDTAANILSYYIFYDPPLPSGEFAAHIHAPGGYGVSVGAPPHTLPPGPLKQGTWNYDEVFEEVLLTGRAYVLLHSFAMIAGEGRGQIVPALSVLEADQTVPQVMSPAVGYALLSVDEAANEIGYDVRIADLTGMETSTVFHGPAPVGMSGPSLFSTPLGDRKVSSEVVAPSVIQDLYDCEIYVDVHTSAFPGGELRGQLTIPVTGEQEFVRGDCDASGGYNIADPIGLLNYLFPAMLPAPQLDCDDACDCNDDGSLNLVDAICMLNGLFGVPAVPPLAPHPGCGVDPTSDGLDCASFAPCP